MSSSNPLCGLVEGLRDRLVEDSSVKGLRDSSMEALAEASSRRVPQFMRDSSVEGLRDSSVEASRVLQRSNFYLGTQAHKSGHRDILRVRKQQMCKEIRDKLITNQPNSLQQGTKVKSEGKTSSHKGLYKDIEGELGTNLPLSLQEAGVEPVAPKISLVSRDTREALEKKLKRMNRHEQNLLILKKFLKVSQEKKGGYNGVFFATSFPSEADVRGVERRVKNMAIRLTRVSLHEWLLSGLTSLGVKVTDSNINGAFEETLFKGVAEFILHTFDMEDLERFKRRHKLKPVYLKFWNEILSNLKSENPYQLVAEGKIDLDGFPSLREQDVGYILRLVTWGFHVFDRVVRLMDFGWRHNVSCCFKKGCHDRFVEMARTVLLNYVPVEEDMKTYSILGGVRSLDAIHDEALSNIDRILELEKCDEIVALRFKDFLASLIKRRYCVLKSLCFSATYGLSFGKLGSFAKEVFKLVEIAEIRRRFLSHRFISKHHILWAVRLTEFKDFVDRLAEDIGLRVWVEKPATCPPYSIYILARATADIHGAEVVGVEHIVVATIFKMMLGKDLNEFNNIHCVKMFLDAVRDYKQKSDVQGRLNPVNSGNKKHLDNRSSDMSLNAEVGDEDDDCDADSEIDDYCLEYVNKIKNLRRSKKYKDYKWSGSIRSKRTVF